MADVFISYARPDGEHVAAIACALAAAGFSVWWDQALHGGDEFSEAIERELAAAGAVIVCWSQASVHSRWVRDEASLAADAGRLVAVSLDGTEAPIGFRQFHCISLHEWGDDPETHDLHELITSVRRRVSGKTEIQRSGPSDYLTPRIRWQGRRSLASLAVAGIAVLAVVAWITVAFVRSPDDSGKEPRNKSIVVLPFVNISDEEDSGYFSDGISEELMSALSDIDGLNVVARTSSFYFKGKDLPASEIASQLSVNYLMEGSVRKSGNRVRITARLIDAANGTRLWSDSFDRTLTDIFIIQKDIADEVSSRLKMEFAGSPSPQFPENTEAYLQYLQAIHHRNLRGQENLIRSEELFRKALQTEPTYVQAWVGLADVVKSQAIFLFRDRDDAYSVAQSALDQALAIDPDFANAHLMAARLKIIFDWDFHGGVRAINRAYELDAENPVLDEHRSNFFAMLGMYDLAILARQSLVHSDPMNGNQHVYLSMFFHLAGEYEQAHAQIEAAYGLEPRLWRRNWYLGQNFMLRGQLEDAVDLGDLHPCARSLAAS